MLAEIFKSLALLKEILDIAKGFLGFIEKNKEEAWFKDCAKTFGNFQQKTPEERAALAKSISDLLRRI